MDLVMCMLIRAVFLADLLLMSREAPSEGLCWVTFLQASGTRLSMGTRQSAKPLKVLRQEGLKSCQSSCVAATKDTMRQVMLAAQEVGQRRLRGASRLSGGPRGQDGAAVFPQRLCNAETRLLRADRPSCTPV